MNNIFKHRLILAALFLSLTSCGGNDVDAVKKSHFKSIDDFNIGQLMDGRKACSKTDWRSYKDDRGRKIVEYSCTYQPGIEYIKNAIQKEIKAGEEYPEERRKLNDFYISTEEKQVIQSQNELQSAIDEGRPTMDHEYRLEVRIKQAEKNKQRIIDGLEKDLQSNNVKLALLRRRAEAFQDVKELTHWTIQDSGPIYVDSAIIVKYIDQEYKLAINQQFLLHHATKNYPDLTDYYRVYLHELMERYR